MSNFLHGRSGKRLAVALPFFVSAAALLLFSVAFENLFVWCSKHLQHFVDGLGEWMNVRPEKT